MRNWDVVAALVVGAVISACGSASTSAPLPSGDAEHPIVMTFAPSGDLPRSDGPSDELIARLEQKTGLKFKLVIAASPAAAIEAIGARQAQMGWLDPFSYIVARKRHNAQVSLVVIRDGSDHFNSQIIANRAAGIQMLGDLKGKTFCFVNPASPAGYVIPRIILQANGIDPDKDFKPVVNAGSHVNVAAAVYKGDCAAGATVVDARTNIQKDFPDVMDRVAVVDVSPSIPNEAITFVRGFPADKKDKIVQALLDIVSMEDGKKFLALHSADGFVKRDDSFYSRFRDLLTKAGVDITQYIAK